ncbi:MAG: hypothetical protein IJL74_01375 [Bacilli bacterium]|nr:hypothetical protein [Bacilli bacterium]
MYYFFIISGYLFVVGLSIVFDHLFELFPITKLTKFLSPIDETTFNRIGIVIIPNIVWSLIELIILGNNKLFVLGLLLNIFISVCVMYVIKFGYDLIANKESGVVNIIAIFFSCFFGFFCNYICLAIGTNKQINPLFSLLGVLILVAIYVIIRVFPPKIEFFKGKNITK